MTDLDSTKDEQIVDYINAVEYLAELIYHHSPDYNFDGADYRDARREAEEVLSKYRFFGD